MAYLDVITIPAEDPAVDFSGDLPCIGCGEPLDIHQPDPDSPCHMLGVCPDCRIWHMILMEPGLGTTSVQLPMVAPIRGTWGFRDGDG